MQNKTDAEVIDEAIEAARRQILAWGIAVKEIPVTVSVRADRSVEIWFRRDLPDGVTIDPDEVPVLVGGDLKVTRLPIM